MSLCSEAQLSWNSQPARVWNRRPSAGLELTTLCGWSERSKQPLARVLLAPGGHNILQQQTALPGPHLGAITRCFHGDWWKALKRHTQVLLRSEQVVQVTPLDLSVSL